MAVGLKIKLDHLDSLKKYLQDRFTYFEKNLFEKRMFYDFKISVNQINDEFLNMINEMEPFGKGNEEPQFLIRDIIIENAKVIKNKHILIFFKNDLGKNLKGILFNRFNTELGDYILQYNQYKFHFLCTIKKDNFSHQGLPQIQINDAILKN